MHSVYSILTCSNSHDRDFWNAYICWLVSLYISVRPSVCLSIYLSLPPSVHLPVCPSIHQSFYPATPLSTCFKSHYVLYYLRKELVPTIENHWYWTCRAFLKIFSLFMSSLSGVWTGNLMNDSNAFVDPVPQVTHTVPYRNVCFTFFLHAMHSILSAHFNYSESNYKAKITY